MSELKDCPMCGNQPRLVDLEGWEIWCKCGVQLCLEQPDKEPLVEAWNRRAPVSTPQQSAQCESVVTAQFWALLESVCNAWLDLDTSVDGGEATFAAADNLKDAQTALIAHINAWGSGVRNSALEEAAKICDETWVCPGDLETESCHEAASKIRGLAAPSPAPQGEQA